jgi:N-alpha-acetyl-L-2,4-diaminobutyrate deacetylase
VSTWGSPGSPAAAGLPLGPSAISPDVDFELDGVQHGFLRLPHSRDDSAWGAVMIPVTVVRDGPGPTALLTGGNHGDEYEGPIALFKLARSLRAEQVRGRVIIIPAMNYPAFLVARRTSPLDDRNLNRIFPGHPDGSPSERIADYFTRYLLPLADVVLDYHSGGKTLDFLPLAAIHELDDPVQTGVCQAALTAFNAPYSLMMREMDARGMYDTTAEAMGRVFVTTELGGAGTATAKSVGIAERGVRNLLIHAGILEGEIELRPTIWLQMPDERCFVTSRHGGLLELLVDLGEPVEAGQPIGWIHPIERTGESPVAYHAGLGGVLAARHVPGLIKTGDCLAVIAVPQR